MPPAIFTVAAEGDVDARICQRILEFVGLSSGPIYVQRGNGNLDQKLLAYNNAARFAHWLVLRDLDYDAECAPNLIRDLIPVPAPYMVLRLTVRSAEAWLLADRERIRRFLGVPEAIVPIKPDDEDHPKTTLVNLARRSGRRSVREDMVPGKGHSSSVGAGYTARVTEFAMLHWRPDVAAEQSDSLSRCIKALQELN